jgi:NFU1 iron-sulfur cluster scaffold homolog, mitochondrial
MFIQTETTPNPLSLKFLPGREVLPEEHGTGVNFGSPMDAVRSTLARQLFQIKGVSTVFFGRDFVSVNISDDSVPGGVTGFTWDTVKPQVFAIIMDHFASGAPVITGAAEAVDTEILDDDDEVVALIKELLETRIRPAVQGDGGDIVYRGFDEASGMVNLELAGSCVGCPSSSATLQHGVQNMLMHYIPEVRGVNQIIPEDQAGDVEGQVSSDPWADKIKGLETHN